MPKVKKKNIGGNPILFVKTAKKAVELGKKAGELYSSILTLKEQKRDLYNSLIDKVKNGDNINEIGKLLETELSKNDTGISKELKLKIKKVKKIYDEIPTEELSKIQPTVKRLLGSTNSIQPTENSEGLLNQGANQANQVNQGNTGPQGNQARIERLDANTRETNKKTSFIQKIIDKINIEYDNANNRSMGNIMTDGFGTEHRRRTGVANSIFDDLTSNSGINLEYSKTPEDISNSRSMHIMLAIALKAILRYTWNLFVVIVKASYRVLTDFILIPFYIFLPYVFDVLAVFIISIMLILVILYYASGGGSKRTRLPGNPFDSIISGVSSIISSFFNPDLSGTTELKDDFQSDATSFVGRIEKIIEKVKEIIAPAVRRAGFSPDINDIDEKYKRKREEYNEGRCNNIIEIESKDGRYCYKQLKQQNTTWGDNITIPYKLFDISDMDNPTANTHYDYYMPNCKKDNHFTDAFIDLDTEHSRRTNFVCKI